MAGEYGLLAICRTGSGKWGGGHEDHRQKDDANNKFRQTPLLSITARGKTLKVT